MQKHTYELGIIGNCAYIGLIDKTANIRWLCWPRFDSSFIFGDLLDQEKGGHFSVSGINGNVETNQYYIKNTNVLCTEFKTEEGAFRVTDFAPRFEQYERYYKPLMLVRKIEPLQGTPKVKVSCCPVGDYGARKPDIHFGSNHLRYLGLDETVRLATNISLNYVKEETAFALTEPKYLILTWGVPLEGPIETTAEDFLRKTIHYWQHWVQHCTIENYHQDHIIRSALTLKVHQYEDTGAIIASATTSLPEHDQSGRNWDYRYCWMRDSFYTLMALNHIGHFEELYQYSSYVENLTMSAMRRYNPVYTILGNEDFEERILDLSGYMENKPVRVGNQAKEHIQNDVYGQILVSLLPAYVDERYVSQGRVKGTKLIYDLLDAIEKTMDEPDAGLWEFRNKSQKHCYTYLFHWAGACSAQKIAQKIQDNKMLEIALKLKEEASQHIEKCYNPELGAYTQAIGTTNMDASLLQLITMNYLDPTSEKAAKHLNRLEEELKTPEGLFFRYKHADDFGAPENTFLICTFWYIEALACVGRIQEAKALLDNILQYTNHLGLLSEDVHAKTGSQWGNFPQTYSHVGLMTAASRIARKMDLPDFYTFS
ncbi:glycoside hydrolase family 15 protein [Fulvivirgaceae bacterium BMA10]|uniref:Glycoside hydrolase family 15 protein n=1 Tax=Splendidivirga corallicola TaxID=3051826 RepID=A0ABT8KN05_9BACT|nr:glycoside hydrolase family 15 protein [Fulvivirgaceae bacterium BMA10]